MTERKKIANTKIGKINKDDTRTRVRISHDAKVHMLLGSEVVNGYLRDISQQGLYFFSNDIRNITSQDEQSVFIEVYMEQGESALVVEARGFVVRTDENGCAINFSHTLLWWPVFSVFPTGSGGEGGALGYQVQDLTQLYNYPQQLSGMNSTVFL